MGVYINMEMPKAEFGSMIVAIRPDGMVEDVMGCYVGKAVPVTEPHGRLGDLDKLNEEMRLFIRENMLSRDDARGLLETIADAPTIIPVSTE